MKENSPTEQPKEKEWEVEEAESESSESSEELDLEVNREKLEAWLDSGTAFQLVDIRESHELHNGVLTDAWNIPMNSIPDEMSFLPKTRPIVLVCAAGMRSYQVAHFLRENGVEEAWSLDGGVADWADKGFLYPERGVYAMGNRVTLAPPLISEYGPTTSYGRVQNVRKEGSLFVYQIGLWTDDGYLILDDIKEVDLSYYTV
jgi:rhodanese-related sulfurtransferase